jgi:dolichyl-phosphate-mannose-protein mannosyltransferase
MHAPTLDHQWARPAPGKQGRPAAREWWLMLVLVVAGAALRLAHPHRMAVEHFDEAVYASNIWFGPENNFAYPDQHLYAPPLLPWLIEWGFTFLGPSNLGAMLPSLAAGCLMIPLVWWVGRSWFGPAAGIAAAALAAFCDLHILFSRTALTDVLLSFWLLGAVYLSWRAVESGRVWQALAAGVATGLAWWTKYTGWLALAITLSGLLPWIGLKLLSAPHADGRPSPFRRRIYSALLPLLSWALIAAAAFVVWYPHLKSLEKKGGYAAVAANHRGYLVGISGWWDALTAQLDNLRQIEGVASFTGLMAACLACLLLPSSPAGRFTGNGGEFAGETRYGVGAAWPVCLLLALQALGFFWPPPATTVLLTLLAAAFLAASLPGLVRHRGAAETPSASLATWMLTAWFLGTILSTPLYTPYPRLLLPFVVSSWLAGGAAIARLSGLIVSRLQRPRADSAGALSAQTETASATRRSLRHIGVPLLVAAMGGQAALQLTRRDVAGWSGRQSLAELTRDSIIVRLQESVAAEGFRDLRHVAIYTFADPALAFQLRLSGADNVRPVTHLEFAAPAAPPQKIPTFVVVGGQAILSKQWESVLREAEPRLEQIASFDCPMSLVVSLDNRPAELRPGKERRVKYPVVVYRAR